MEMVWIVMIQPLVSMSVHLCYLSILLSFIECISSHESEFIRSKIAFACL
jgi:hypothetical protein